MATITILGLGPGDAALLTRQAWDILQSARTLYLRTAIHPTVAALPAHLDLRSFDHLYETADAFGEVYEQIANALITRANTGEDVLYATPGHPLIAEATTRRLLEQARAQGINTHIIAGVSFIEPVCAALALDPLNHGLQLLDALDLVIDEPKLNEQESGSNSDMPPAPDAAWSEMQGIGPYTPQLTPFPLLATRPALICQVYNRRVASHVKLSLMERYPSDQPVTFVRAAGVSGEEQVWTVPLHEIDHQEGLDHLTCAYLPPLDPLNDVRSPDGITTVVARLLGPGGCPWDREQTHVSIRKDLLSETYEVLEALDAGDMPALAEEMGDVLLNLIMHSEMARQAGDFDLGDVYEHVTTKLIRRHPHVFGATNVANSNEVLTNWDAIKRAERADKGQAPRGTLDGIPPGLPALMTAQETVRKASKAGFDSDDQVWPWEKLREELDELYAAVHTETHANTTARAQRIEEEFGDLLLAAAKLGQRMKVDTESALRTATARFRQRFAFIEQQLHDQGRELNTLSTAEKLALWQQAKQADSLAQ